MDYYDELERESHDAHAIFHNFILALSEVPQDSFFGFFEGEEDPAFYTAHISQRLAGRALHTFICNGRSAVLKANKLILADGRGTDRTLFFIDKDHTNIMNVSGVSLANNIFQTELYSIENYLVCDEVFSRFWVERLHLSSLDPRLNEYLGRYRNLRSNFFKRSKIIMSIVLFGRGIDGRETVKLNLNNVKFEKVINLDVQRGLCIFRKNAGKHFLASSNISQLSTRPRGDELRKIIRDNLTMLEPSSYIRGKYELWFFWKVLSEFTRELSDRENARIFGKRRATPTWTLAFSGCVESLAPLLSCPPALAHFLNARVATSS